MRILLTLSHRKYMMKVPVNNCYLLSSIIYNIIDNSSSEYAERLHDKGYRLGNKSFKLFTYSSINPANNRKWEMQNDGIMSTSERSLQFMISSPLKEFIEHLVIGMLHKPFVRLGEERLRVDTVKRIDPPEFSSDMRFIAMSPLVCTKKSDTDEYAQYLFPGDDEFERKLYENLCGKYEALYSIPFCGDADSFRFSIDMDYVERRKGKVQKLITIKEGGPEETKVKGTLAPFRLQAPPDLIEIGYNCGFGEKNSQGFGMVKEDRYHYTSERIS
jgi:CRISPR-associated endoribonuclease Cas6